MERVEALRQKMREGKLVKGFFLTIRAICYGLVNENGYIREAYEKVLKIAQIETMEAYENLEEILRVEGLDSLFIGAADLSRSIQGRADGTELKAVYEDICRRVREKGRFQKNFLFMNCNIP